MKKDASIQTHFGDDVDAFSAVVTGVPFDSYRLPFYYYLDSSQTSLDPALQQDTVPSRILEKPYNGKPLERVVQSDGRGLYVFSEFGVPCAVTYRKYNGRGVSSAATSLKPLHHRALVKARRGGELCAVVHIQCVDESGGAAPRPKTTAPRPPAMETHHWSLVELPSRVTQFLSEAMTAVKPTPRVRVEVGQRHVTLTYYCHRGPPCAHGTTWQERHGLLQHVPSGCVAKQSSLPTNVGCAWIMTLRFPDHYLPEMCPVTGESFAEKGWYIKAKLASQSASAEVQTAALVKCTIHHDHSGHVPGSAADKPFLPISREAKEFAMILFSWHMSPAEVEAIIAQKIAQGHFEKGSNARSMPTLKERQDWTHEASKEDWLDQSSWVDMLEKVKALERAGHVISEHHDYDPSNTDPERRGFKLFV